MSEVSLLNLMFYVTLLNIDCRQRGLPRWLSGGKQNRPANAGDNEDELGRSPRVGNGNPLQYYCLENPMDRGAWRATVRGFTKS